MMQELHISRTDASAVNSPKSEELVGIARAAYLPIAGHSMYRMGHIDAPSNSPDAA
jgi:hypothetical protein